jgi:AcrR family transcriptional regulator
MPGRRPIRELDAAILNASLEILRAEGFAGFSIERVANKVHIPRSTIYARWPSRAELLDAVLAAAMTTTPAKGATLSSALVELLTADLRLTCSIDGRSVAQALLAARDSANPATQRMQQSMEALMERYRIVFDQNGCSQRAVPTALELIESSLWGHSMLHAVNAHSVRGLTDVIMLLLQSPDRE